MPRYCAVKLCKNRGGIPSKDNKKISFYPFPLRDEARLQKWVDNMKREEWTPSRHQYLCSDHFTEDSFDLRWGIRYLKHTAVPTIFPFIYEGEDTPIQDEVSKLRCKKNLKPARRKSGISVKPVGTSAPPKKRALVLKRNTCGQDKDDSAEKEPEPAAKAADPSFPTLLLIRDLDLETVTSREAAVTTETANRSLGGERILVTSCVGAPGELRRGADGGPAATALCAETAPPSASPEPVSDKPPPEAAPTDGAGPGPRSGDDSDRPVTDGEHGLLYEHSYSRQNTDKDQLWSKIAGLHLKITELEKREEDTVAKIASLEAVIAHLKRENVVCAEKQKELEDYFTTVFL
ncbi:THAP domain-containing protein 5-like isoform X1 [Anguilla rostrata]|uniref:THAP domain-containing protein 5-like isoform X1 n=2 Tax=Anguilla rostrata TaxID=7938 RepID=UPI0030D2B537